MKPRNKRCRHILNPPQVVRYLPDCLDNDKEPVVLLFEEFEALRLADYELLKHDAAASHMRISRATFARIYESVRRKLAKAFVEARPVVFQSGFSFFEHKNIHSQLVNRNYQPLNELEMNKVIAIPCESGVLAGHFGHASEFAFITCEGNEVRTVAMEAAPAHEPGLLPRWVAERGAKVVIAGGMGSKAIELFRQNGVDVVTGAPGLEVEALAKQFIDGKLTGGDNRCDH